MEREGNGPAAALSQDPNLEFKLSPLRRMLNSQPVQRASGFVDQRSHSHIRTSAGNGK